MLNHMLIRVQIYADNEDGDEDEDESDAESEVDLEGDENSQATLP